MFWELTWGISPTRKATRKDSRKWSGFVPAAWAQPAFSLCLPSFCPLALPTIGGTLVVLVFLTLTQIKQAEIRMICEIFELFQASRNQKGYLICLYLCDYIWLIDIYPSKRIYHCLLWGVRFCENSEWNIGGLKRKALRWSSISPKVFSLFFVFRENLNWWFWGITFPELTVRPWK